MRIVPAKTLTPLFASLAMWLSCAPAQRPPDAGVVVNDVSSFRADQMPYGGAKESGYGREGLRYAMEEMTEGRILVLSDVPL